MVSEGGWYLREGGLCERVVSRADGLRAGGLYSLERVVSAASVDIGWRLFQRSGR